MVDAAFLLAGGQWRGFPTRMNPAASTVGTDQIVRNDLRTPVPLEGSRPVPPAQVGAWP